MEYPNSILTHKIRIAILIAYFAVFLILCPFIILYASGYRYDWKQGFPKRTGAISVNVEPLDTKVFINNVEAPRDWDVQTLSYKKEVRLTSVPPGKYTIKITKTGYYDWIKDVEVKEMQSIYIKEIILMKKNTPELLDGGGVIKNISLSPSGNYLAYAEEDGAGAQIWLRRVSDGTSQQILNFKNADIKFSWDGKNDFLAISSVTAPYDTLIVLSAENPEKKFDLSKKTKSPINKYQWKEALEPELFFSTPTKIMSVLPATQKILTLGKNTFLDWQMENGQLWTLSTNTTTNIISIDKDTLGFKEIFNTLDGDTLGKEWNKTKFLTATRNNLLLEDRAGLETILITKDKKNIFAGENFVISPYNNWWLIWSPWELWSYTEGQDPMLLNRAGEQLHEVLPMDKYNALALIWENNATILYPYYLVTHALIDAPVNDAVVDTENRIFYFSGNIKGQDGLWRLVY